VVFIFILFFSSSSAKTGFLPTKQSKVALKLCSPPLLSKVLQGKYNLASFQKPDIFLPFIYFISFIHPFPST